MNKSDEGGMSVRERIVAIKLRAAERRIQPSKEKAACSAAVLGGRLDSARELVRKNNESVEKLDRLKEEFAELQAELSKAQSVKTRNDSKMNVLKEELKKQSEKVDKIKKVLSDKQTKLEEYSSIVSNTSSNLKDLESKVVQEEEHLNTAIGWYQNILGFQVIGGNEGLTFIFTKINPNNPKKEYSFTVNLQKNKFILSKCEPFMEVDELVKELKKTNDLFRFVRVMRAKFASFFDTDTDSMNSESNQQASSPVTTSSQVISPVLSSPFIPPVESSPVLPSPVLSSQVEMTPVIISKSGKGKKTPISSIRRSSRLRRTGGS